MSYPSLFKTTIMKIILLDDERNMSDIKWIHYPQHDEVIVIRTYLDFTNFIDSLNSLEGLLFTFDHDIQDFYDDIEYTGLDCAKYLVDSMMDNPDNLKKEHLNYIVHSQNPVGSLNIISYIETFKTHFEPIMHPSCDGCGHSGPDVYTDSGGFNVCLVNHCTSYSVRGLHPSDFL